MCVKEIFCAVYSRFTTVADVVHKHEEGIKKIDKNKIAEKKMLVNSHEPKIQNFETVYIAKYFLA